MRNLGALMLPGAPRQAKAVVSRANDAATTRSRPSRLALNMASTEHKERVLIVPLEMMWGHEKARRRDRGRVAGHSSIGCYAAAAC